jgi:hypothetical protein
MKGWVMVAAEAIAGRAALEEWLVAARDFTQQLPPK